MNCTYYIHIIYIVNIMFRGIYTYIYVVKKKLFIGLFIDHYQSVKLLTLCLIIFCFYFVFYTICMTVKTYVNIAASWLLYRNNIMK